MVLHSRMTRFILIIILMTYAKGTAYASHNYDVAFDRYYTRNSLDEQACQDLDLLYKSHAKQYSAHNEIALKQTLPLLNMNGHHRSPFYWARFQSQQQAKTTYKLFHLDTHSDLAFAPATPLKNIAQELKENLDQVSQVIVPAAFSNVIDQALLCLPPWYQRIPLDGKLHRIGLAQFSKNIFVRSKFDRIYPVVKQSHLLATEDPALSPFKALTDLEYKKLVHRTIDFQFIDCYQNFATRVLSAKGNFILGIDLDIFSSNGNQADRARPISPHRKGSTISRTEFTAVKSRVNHIIKQFEELKAKGWSPKLITIANSTKTHKKSIGSGGDFTPNCLAFLLNYKINRELRRIFK